MGNRRLPQALPKYPPPALRSEPFLVLGEVHPRTRVGGAQQPLLLVLPAQGRYTGIGPRHFKDVRRPESLVVTQAAPELSVNSVELRRNLVPIARLGTRTALSGGA